MPEIKEARKRHNVVDQMPLPAGVIDEIATEDGEWWDSDSGLWVATFIKGLAYDLRDDAWALRGKKVSSTSKEEFPTELQPWVDLAGLGDGICAVVTENAPETPVHWDSWTGNGNDQRSTVLSFYTEGEFTGGEYVLAEYGIGFDLRAGDMLMAPSTTIHGNRQRVGDDYIRLGIIMCVDGIKT